MGFCDFPLADKLCAVGDAVDFASNPGKAIGDWMAKSAGELAAASADLAAEAVDTTTKVDLNAGWFRDNYEMLLPLGLVLLVATFCAQLVRAAVRRDGQALTGVHRHHVGRPVRLLRHRLHHGRRRGRRRHQRRPVQGRALGHRVGRTPHREGQPDRCPGRARLACAGRRRPRRRDRRGPVLVRDDGPQGRHPRHGHAGDLRVRRRRLERSRGAGAGAGSRPRPPSWSASC